MTEAAQLLGTLADNTDARAQLSEITMGEALKAQAAGELEKASELYLALGDYGDARANYNACQYELAMRKKEAGDYRAAAPLFAALGAFEDAAAQAEECNYEAYDRYAVPARAAYETKAWKTVIDTLEGFDDTGLPSAYRDLAGMYEEACYNLAEELYGAGKPYEALPYYQRIPDYRDVAAKKLTRRAYLILGVWESEDGARRAVFRADGLCELFGQTLYFAVDGYGLKTGTDPAALTLTHKLTTLTENTLSIRVLADARNAVYPLRRTGDATAALAVELTAPSPAPASESPAPADASPAATATPAPRPTATPKPTAAPTVAPAATGG